MPAIQLNTTPPNTQTKPVFDTFAKVVSPDRLITKEQADKERRRAEEAQGQPEITFLASHRRLKWQASYIAKQTAGTELGSPEVRLMQCLRQRLGQYDPDTLAAIKAQGRSEIYMLVTNIKCRAAQAWIEDVMLPADEPLFDLSPTPVPELPQAKEIEVREQVIQEVTTIYENTPENAAMVTDELINDRIQDIRQKKRTENIKPKVRVFKDSFDQKALSGSLKIMKSKPKIPNSK